LEVSHDQHKRDSGGAQAETLDGRGFERVRREGADEKPPAVINGELDNLVNYLQIQYILCLASLRILLALAVHDIFCAFHDIALEKIFFGNKILLKKEL
jgi:hypothetical protein